jgi:hypothetical protein
MNVHPKYGATRYQVRAINAGTAGADDAKLGFILELDLGPLRGGQSRRQGHKISVGESLLGVVPDDGSGVGGDP